MSDAVTITVSPAVVQVSITTSVTIPGATAFTLGGIQLAADLGGTAEAPIVEAIQGTAIQPPPGGTTEYLRGDGAWAVPAGGGGGAVSSVFTRTGAVVAQSGDYTIGQISGAGSAASHSASDFDAAGSAAAAQSAAIAAAEANAATLYVPLASLPLPFSSGGTGQASRQNAINALAGAVTVGTFLRGDGTNATMSSIQGSDVPTLNQNTTGTAGGLSSTLVVGSGGTGATTPIGARSNLGVYNWDTPAARGMLEYNYPPMLATISNNLVSGSIYGTTIVAQSSGSTGHVGVGVLSSAATPTAGQNLIGLYSISGTTATQITITADLTTWSSQGFQSYAWGSSQALVPGNSYIILFMSNATTPVHLAGLSTTAGFPPAYNAGLSNTAAPWFKVFLYGTAQTALPASFTISGTTMASVNSQSPWVCLL